MLELHRLAEETCLNEIAYEILGEFLIEYSRRYGDFDPNTRLTRLDHRFASALSILLAFSKEQKELLCRVFLCSSSVRQIILSNAA